MGYKTKACPHCGHPLNDAHAKALAKEEKPAHVKVMGRIKRDSEKALLIASGGLEVWVPRSQVKDGAALKAGDVDPEVVAWFVKREGLLPRG